MLDTVMRFYGDCLRTYPELLYDAGLNRIEAAMRGPVPDDPADNPAYRLLVFLSKYKDCAELPSYAAVYAAFGEDDHEDV